MLSSTWTSILRRNRRLDFIPQANADQRSSQGGELRPCRNTLQQGSARGGVDGDAGTSLQKVNVPHTLRWGHANERKEQVQEAFPREGVSLIPCTTLFSRRQSKWKWGHYACGVSIWFYCPFDGIVHRAYIFFGSVLKKITQHFVHSIDHKDWTSLTQGDNSLHLHPMP